MLIARHRVPATTFNVLARGPANRAAMSRLAAGQLSKHMLLIRAVVDSATPRREAIAARLGDAVGLLDEVQRRNPAAATEILRYPLVGAWAAHCLRRLRYQADGEIPLWADLGQLASVAAAAAIRAGVEFEIEVPVRNGMVALPSLGRARLANCPAWGKATLRGRDGEHVIEDPPSAVRMPREPDQACPGWEPLHRFVVREADRTLIVNLDDVDPYRNCHRLSATDRLDTAGVATWRSTLTEAWRLLVRHHPERAEELAAGPVTVIPLVALEGGNHVNVTARDSTGAMALTPPPNPLALALSLVHELQHTKLGALLDLVELYDPQDDRRFYSPWRSDPRPLSGLLQGAYAFLAVGMFWQRHATRATGVVPARVAQYEVARVGAQVRTTLDELSRSGALTDAGVAFVAGLRMVVDASLRTPVPEDVAELARLVLDDHRCGWRLRNVQIDPADLDTLADAWLRRAPKPAVEPSSWLVGDRAPRYAEEPRHELVRHSMQDPGSPGKGPDAALISGDYATAVQNYLAAIRAEPDRVDMWSGLAVARARLGPQVAAQVFDTRPELVFALHRLLRRMNGQPAAPEALASWLGG